MKIDLRKFLLAGTAVVAVSAFTSTAATAADTEMAAAVGTPTNMLTGFASADDLLNIVDDANDFGTLDVDDGVIATTINSDFTGGLAVYDGTNDTASGDVLTVTTFADIASGSTMTLLFGGSVADGSGTDGAEEATLAVGTTLGDAGATTLTRGGVLAVLGVANEENAAGILTVGGNTLMTTITVTAGAGGANEAGGAVTTTFGDASTDTFDVTGMSVIGGAANGAADEIGGAATSTVNGAAAIGTGNLVVTGGAAGAGTGGGVAGGASTLTFVDDVTITGGAVTVTGGADHASAGGAGGDASLTFTGDVTSDSTLLVSTGAQNAAGGGLSGDGSATFTGDATFTAINLNDNGDGAATLTFNGTSAQVITGVIDGVGASEGNVVVSGTGGVTFMNKVGDSAASGIAVLTLDGTGDTSATFMDGVDVGTFTLGGGASAGNTNTLTFNTTTQAFAMTQALIAADGTEVDAVVISGDDILTQTAAWGAGNGIDSLTVSGTATLKNDAALTVADDTATITIENGATIDSNSTIAATTMTINSGGTLDQGAGTITVGTIANAGTINQTGTGAVTANITGAGALDIDGASTWTGTIAAATADVAGVTWAQATGATYAVGTTTFSADGTLAFDAAARTVTGDFTNSTDGEGTITIANGTNTTAFVGDLGASTSNSLKALTLAGGGNNTVTTTGNLFVDAITLDDQDVLQFIGTSAQTVSGTLDGAGASDGVITIGTGASATDVTFAGLIGATNDLNILNVDTLAAATFNGAGDVSFDGAFDNDGTVTVSSNTVLEVGTYTADADAGTINLGIDRQSGVNDFAVLNVLGGAVDLSNDTINFVVESGSEALVAGTTTDIILAAAAQTDAASVTDNSFLYGFALNQVGGDWDLTITVENSITSTGTTVGNDNVGTVLLSAAVTAANDTQLDLIVGNVQSAATADAVNEVLEATQPAVDGGAMVAAVNVVNTSFSIMGDRLASLRTGDVVTGMTTGNVSSGARVWAQGFGATAEQDARDGIDGYDADTFGVAFGIDSENIFENTVMGVAFSYANTDVESENANTTDTEVDSYQFSVYGDHDFNNNVYLNGMAAYTFSDNDSTRHNVGGIGGLTANGEYDADQFTVRAEVGRGYEYDTATLTPHATGHWTHYSADSYTETGAGGANLAVDIDDMDIFELGLGLDVSWMFQNADGSHFSPELSIGYRYDLSGDDVETTSTFTGGGAAFKSEGFDAQQSTFDVGAGFTYYSTDNWELSAEYDYTHKEDFDSHAGLFRAGYRF